MSSSTNELFSNLSKGGEAPKAGTKPKPAPKPVKESSVVEETVEQKPGELEHFKTKADLVGVVYEPDVTVDELKAAIEAKLSGDSTEEQEQAPTTGKTKTLAQHLKDEQMKLVRIRVTCMNPTKKNLPGEIFTLANRHLGTVKKFVPFGEASENGYHVPHCIYQLMRDRKFAQHSLEGKGDRAVPTYRMVREFAIEILPQLTQAELNRIAAAQAARGDA